MGKKRNTEHEHENEERWLLSYADMITLLMAFFVVLYAMSNVDSKKFEQLAISLSQSLGPRQDTPLRLNLYPAVKREGTPKRRPKSEGALEVPPGDAKPLKPPTSVEPDKPEKPESGKGSAQALRREKAERIREEVIASLMKEGSRDDIKVSVSEDYHKVSIRLAASLLFQPGSAEMESSALTMLADLAMILKPLELPVAIEGHTDDIPISTPQYKSNWQLSAARAANVLLYMQNEYGLAPSLLSASGYGEFRPIADNETAENRARNRRVEFVVDVPDEEPAGAAEEPATETEIEPVPLPELTIPSEAAGRPTNPA
jgi:chemotaxis protein MotB